ncbi:MAG: hypothetical protein E7627_08240 [Ruminococcaceae bacterium]|nr:hypothetical protein [Oscillospiraceae bacterium]
MSNTEGYLLFSRTYYVRRSASAFLFYLAVTVLSSVVGYLYFLLFGADGSFAIVDQSKRAADLLDGQILSVIEASVLFVAVYTVCFRWIAAFLCVFRGICLGISIGVYAGCSLLGASGGFAWALVAYFLSSVIFLALASVSHIYSEVVCATYVSEESRNMRPLTIEYTKLFFIISGVFFILGCITVALI